MSYLPLAQLLQERYAMPVCKAASLIPMAG